MNLKQKVNSKYYKFKFKGDIFFSLRATAGHYNDGFSEEETRDITSFLSFDSHKLILDPGLISNFMLFDSHQCGLQ